MYLIYFVFSKVLYFLSLCARALPEKWTVNLPYAVLNKMTNLELLCAILTAAQSWNFYYEIMILLLWF